MPRTRRFDIERLSSCSYCLAGPGGGYQPAYLRTSAIYSLSAPILHTKHLLLPMVFPTFSFSTTAEEVATVFADRIAGKNGATALTPLSDIRFFIHCTVLITGTSLGSLGFETARVIAKHASLIIITGYSAERLRLSEEALKIEVPSANIRCLQLDLSSLAAVRAAAEELNAYPEPLHVCLPFHTHSPPRAEAAREQDGELHAARGVREQRRPHVVRRRGSEGHPASERGDIRYRYGVLPVEGRERPHRWRACKASGREAEGVQRASWSDLHEYSI
ncbi:hypothetical protein C8R47DRAFT_798569 [Mycena vitilis]|nr:hypothetical protein C8R47DRAFT_798569 [Mycena vitilis]